MTRSLLTASAVVMLGSVTPMLGHSTVPFCGADLATMPPARPYVANRHLDARTERSGNRGWMVVKTTLSREGRFDFEVLEEGGSALVRRKALYAALTREQELINGGTPVHMPAVLAGYRCAVPQPQADGLLSVAIRPREPGRHLVNGTLLMEPHSGSVVRVEGQLARNPSFWVSQVQMDWTYRRIDDAVLPASVHARAKVKFVGPSTFDMTYRYISVDGRSAEGPQIGPGR
jgi:hypothetical protein